MSLAPVSMGIPEPCYKNRKAIDQAPNKNPPVSQIIEEENTIQLSNRSPLESIPSVMTNNHDSSQMSALQPPVASFQSDITSLNTPYLFHSGSFHESSGKLDQALPKHPLVPRLDEEEQMTFPSSRVLSESKASLITNTLSNLQMSSFHPSYASFQSDVMSQAPPCLLQSESLYQNVGDIDPFVAHVNREEKKTSLINNSVTNGPGSLQWTCPTAATTRAARKRRLARHRRIIPYQTLTSLTASASSLAWSPVLSETNKQTVSSVSHGREVLARTPIQKLGPEANFRFLLQKELKPSDVGNLGRIILPKRDAEANLPYLAVREGIILPMEDVQESCTWNLRFRFWPNNKSRMYLLENTGDFIKSHHLQEGDFIMIYRDDCTEKYIIRAKKVAQTDSTTTTCIRRNSRFNAIQESKIVIGNKGNDASRISGGVGVNECEYTVGSSNQVSNTKAAHEGCLPMDDNLEEALFKDFVHCLPEIMGVENDSLPKLEHVSGIESNDMPIEELFDLQDQK